MSTSEDDGCNWAPVVGYEGFYEVSDQGDVRSVERVVPRSNGRRHPVSARTLKPRPHRGGYLRVALCRDGVQCNRAVHRLVLEAFIGPAPEGTEACHNNGDPADNRLENLRWDTSSANNYDMVRNGNHVQARKTHCSRGHQYDNTNTYSRPGGGRGCRACRREDSLRRAQTTDRQRCDAWAAEREAAA